MKPKKPGDLIKKVNKKKHHKSLYGSPFNPQTRPVGQNRLQGNASKNTLSIAHAPLTGGKSSIGQGGASNMPSAMGVTGVKSFKKPKKKAKKSKKLKRAK